MNDNVQSQIVTYLNQYLSSIAVLTNNLYVYHWDIVGPEFFSLHAKFQDYYEKATNEFDAIAERIRQLGGYPVTIGKYSAMSGIKETESKSYNGNEAIRNIINDFKVIHRMASDIASYAESIGDGVTSSLLGDYVTYLEKQLWMLEANLK